MFGGLNRTVAAAVVAGAFLVVPSTALACNNGISAVAVYSECLQGGGGGGKATGGGSSVNISPQTARALKKAGADRQSLGALVKGYGASRMLMAQSDASNATAPTAVGSAFDLSGPTALLIILAGAAILLLGATGYRKYRRS